MNIKFIESLRTSEFSVNAIYELDGVGFTVEWNSIHAETGETSTYDLLLDVKSIDEDLANRVSDAIRAGESDANPDIELYLFVRDTFYYVIS